MMVDDGESFAMAQMVQMAPSGTLCMFLLFVIFFTNKIWYSLGSCFYTTAMRDDKNSR